MTQYPEKWRGVQRQHSLAWIRSVHTSLKNSQLVTRGNPAAFEVQGDVEIYVGTMCDLRDLMKAYQPQLKFVRS